MADQENGMLNAPLNPYIERAFYAKERLNSEMIYLEALQHSINRCYKAGPSLDTRENYKSILACQFEHLRQHNEQYMAACWSLNENDRNFFMITYEHCIVVLNRCIEQINKYELEITTATAALNIATQVVQDGDESPESGDENERPQDWDEDPADNQADKCDAMGHDRVLYRKTLHIPRVPSSQKTEKVKQTYKEML